MFFLTLKANRIRCFIFCIQWNEDENDQFNASWNREIGFELKFIVHLYKQTCKAYFVNWNKYYWIPYLIPLHILPWKIWWIQL